MLPHETDQFGFPIDPKLRVLEDHLCRLAGDWRDSRGNAKPRESIRQEYHLVMMKMYSSGWDGILDAECELPNEFMPDEYMNRHPRPSGANTW